VSFEYDRDRNGGLFDLDHTRGSAVVFVVLALDAVYWVLTYISEVPMPGMKWLMMERSIPMAAPGAMELATFHVGTLDAYLGYVVMWGVMMWAMMMPAMTRFVRDYAKSHRGSTVAASLSVGSFLASYQLVWLLTGVVPLAMHFGLSAAGFEGIYGAVKSYPYAFVGGALVLTGLYQSLWFKNGFLRDCCANVNPHENGLVDSFGRGLRHGTKCVFITFPFFFFLMPVFGEMNFLWMVGLTTVVTVERLPFWGNEVATATSIISLLAGLSVLVVQPDLGLSFVMSMGM
jgi:predicted metal-binding membrane protein